MADSVDFWFDPGCPFTWRTSRWLVDVASRRGLDVTWRIMSLAILNEGNEIPEQWRERMERGKVAVRFLEAVRAEHGNEALGVVYTELGTQVHGHGAMPDEDAFRKALGAAGLPAELASAGDDDTHQAAVAHSHADGQERVGQPSGSPILAIGDGPGYHGPVVVPIPEGEAALRLFDAVALLSAVPAFSELKRARQPF
jgi:2-hydroxychromene-2-carboxylate isomerase